MTALILSALFALAGVVTLLPGPFEEFLRDYGVTVLAGLVLAGIIAGHLLAEIEIRDSGRLSRKAWRGRSA